MKRTILFSTILLLAIGCGSSKRRDPLLNLSAAEALEQGKDLLAQEKYRRAEELLTHAFEVEPNSRSGREALLLAANALFLQGGSNAYIRCEAKYRDFLNRFPTSERSDYAQFQVGNCLAKRVESPDRDQQVTRQALVAYEELLRLYPTSEFAEETREKIHEVTVRLADHEFVIGEFYLRFGMCAATIQRIEYLREQFPEFERMDEALTVLVQGYEACARPEDAEELANELERRYAGSPFLDGLDKKREKWAEKAQKLLDKREKQRDKRRRGA